MEDKLKALILEARERAASAEQATKNKREEERERARLDVGAAFQAKLTAQLGAEILLLLSPVYDATFHATGQRWLGLASFDYNGKHFELREGLRSLDLELRKQGNHHSTVSVPPSGNEFLLALGKLAGM